MSGYANPTEPNLYPDAFQALVKLEDYQELEEKLARASWAPGQFECKKCGCYLVANVISMQSGNIGANPEPQQCGNGCGPMWRVTWQEYSKKIGKSQDAMVERLLEAQETIERLRRENLWDRERQHRLKL